MVATKFIQAAGGIVVRNKKRPLVAVVQRAKDDAWVLPRGKLKRDESAKAGAHREVVEETGHRIAVNEFLGAMTYRAGGKAKVVQFWQMQAEDDASHELMADIIAVEWLPLKAAVRRLSYPLEKLFLRNVGQRALQRRDTRKLPPWRAAPAKAGAKAGTKAGTKAGKKAGKKADKKADKKIETKTGSKPGKKSGKKSAAKDKSKSNKPAKANKSKRSNKPSKAKKSKKANKSGKSNKSKKANKSRKSKPAKKRSKRVAHSHKPPAPRVEKKSHRANAVSMRPPSAHIVEAAAPELINPGLVKIMAAQNNKTDNKAVSKAGNKTILQRVLGHLAG